MKGTVKHINHELWAACLEVSVNCPESGLTVKCELDKNDYHNGIKVSDTEMQSLNIEQIRLGPNN
jgi:hypothetical protein